MSKPLPYAPTLIALAVAAARREFQQRGINLLTRGGRHYIVRTVGTNDALPIARNARTWIAS